MSDDTIVNIGNKEVFLWLGELYFQVKQRELAIALLEKKIADLTTEVVVNGG